MYTVAIVGATGAVGQEMLRLLEQKKIPIKQIRCFASARSTGKTTSFLGSPIPIEVLDQNSFKNVDIAFFSAGKETSKAFVPIAVNAGAIVIDNSSAFRMDKQVPLVIPEVNRHALASHNNLISSPNCIATILLMALTPLHRLFKIDRIVAATYQAASGAGALAMRELEEETKAFLEGRPFQRTVMPHPYAFNIFAHNAPMTSSGYNEEEIKVVEESKKILESPALRLTVTCIRVPVLRAHSLSLNVAFENPASPEEARKILNQTPGVTLLEDWKQNRFPMPSDATGQNAVFVGRIRQDPSSPHTLDLWAVGDQLLKGAALNALQIAETILNI